MTNLDLFRAIIERGFNQGDLAVADEVRAGGRGARVREESTDEPGTRSAWRC
ncbi:MAG TPA: hypothetical protein VMW19_20990 [Myxococcota bacterium]|nr:hypothetical protein [Myxococcota bacterium]